MPGADQHVLLRAFADELPRCGVRHAVTSPGSRSTPLLIALARDGRFTMSTHVDERAAGFFALGVAKASGLPAVVVCTSGTAAANLAPAVHEAAQARVPMLVLTADRPPELRERGAGQVIDQVKLYGDAVRWYAALDVAHADEERARWVRQTACRAVWTALGPRPGPVHLNVPLREPLVPPDPLPADPVPGRPEARPWVTRVVSARPEPRTEDDVRRALARARRPLVVAGRHDGDDLARAAHETLGTTLPVLAEPLSGARTDGAVAHYDALLRDPAFAGAHRPDLVVRFGDLPTSKPLRQWLAGLDAEQVLVDREEAWQDPAGVVAQVLATDPASLWPADAPVPAAEPGWLDAWREADAAAARAIEATLAHGLGEPAVARDLVARLPKEATVVVASSMPVRDVETFAPARDHGPRVLSNRGANGIDGTLSTAFGVKAHDPARPVVCLLGDVAFLHDLTGLQATARLGLTLTVVVLNNDGGGIFEFLPIAGETDVFETHIATPHGLDLEHASRLFGCDHVRPGDLGAFRAALDDALDAGRTTVIEVRTDRAENVALHRRVWDAVAAAVR